MSDELLSVVLALPAAQRAELAQRLLASLEPDASPEVDAAWISELDRRARDFDEGRTQGIPWSEARESILTELKTRRAARSSS